MLFISSRTKAQFFNGSQLTFLVKKDHVDIIFKIKRGVYLTTEVYSLSEGRLLLACAWGTFLDRLKSMSNRNEVIEKLRKVCPKSASVFTKTTGIHFAYLQKGSKEVYVVNEIKAPKLTNSISDFLEPEVIDAAINLMQYNLDMQVELEENCPFPAWKKI